MIKKAVYSFAGIIFLTGCGQSSGVQEHVSSEETQKESTSANQFGRGVISDGADTNAEEEPMLELTDTADSIVIYFSRSGHTEDLAKQIQNWTDADILELQVKQPYPADYEESVKRATMEIESGNYPELATDIPDLSQYKTILLGHPIWGMSPANPIGRFLADNQNELVGKDIASFSTNAGYGAGNTVELIKKLSPESTILENYTVEDRLAEDNQSSVQEWLERLELLKR